MLRDVTVEVCESRDGTVDAEASRWLYTHVYVPGSQGVIPPRLSGYRGGERVAAEAKPDEEATAAEDQAELFEVVLSWLLYSGPESAAAQLTQALPEKYMRELVDGITQHLDQRAEAGESA
jgi:hypothetical protein